MSNELDLPHPLCAYVFTITDVGAAGPTDGILAGGNGKGGPVVPTGYKFVPVFIDAEYNAARTGGTSTVKVTAAGTELVGGPEALIDATNTTNDTGSITGAPDSVAAGEEIGVSATGAGTFAPATADATVIVHGYYMPA
jgi:hypothetical protein